MKLSDNLRIALQIAEAEERGEIPEWEVRKPGTDNWREPGQGISYYIRLAYDIRRKPEPVLKKTVPLGPEDVPPGSVIYDPSWPKGTWELVRGLGVAGACTRNEFYEWQQLMDKGYQISRDNGKTWEPCTKEIEA